MKLFDKPWLEVIKLSINDVLTGSPNDGDPGFDPDEPPIDGEY